MAKRSFNIYVDEASIARAERYSERHGTSVSKLVDDFLARLPLEEADDGPSPLTPTVRRLLGAARGSVDVEDYREHLRKKHGT